MDTPAPKSIPAFAEKLQLVLARLNLSRAALAREVGIDKSLAGRWARGGVLPGQHSLTKLTALVRAAVPGFSMLDWHLAPAAFAGKLGLAAPAPAPSELATRLDRTPALREALEGFWINIYQSLSNAGHLNAHAGRIFWNGRDVISEIHDPIIRLVGPIRYVDPHCYVAKERAGSGQIVFSILHAPLQGKSAMMDGMILAVLGEAAMSTAATPQICVRLGDFCGDTARDQARFERLSHAVYRALCAGEIEALLPEALRRHLRPRVDPAANNPDEDRVTRVPLARSLSLHESLLLAMAADTPRRQAYAALRQAFAPALAETEGNVTVLDPRQIRRPSGTR
jgi:transcriptional regulator with XRE-family HTH domain